VHGLETSIADEPLLLHASAVLRLGFAFYAEFELPTRLFALRRPILLQAWTPSTRFKSYRKIHPRLSDVRLCAVQMILGLEGTRRVPSSFWSTPAVPKVCRRCPKGADTSSSNCFTYHA
jgi:hypothetical protein